MNDIALVDLVPSFKKAIIIFGGTAEPVKLLPALLIGPDQLQIQTARREGRSGRFDHDYKRLTLASHDQLGRHCRQEIWVH